MSDLKKIEESIYLLPKKGKMRVPGLIVAKESELATEGLQKSLEQVENVACLPGIINYSIAMPDMHWGYGFPIGGVAAMDAETGVISPGGVGYDINCGVRLAIVPISFREMSEKIKDELLKEIFKKIPSGAGKGKTEKILMEQDYEQIARKGVAWSIEQGFGFEKDIEYIESRGLLEEADTKAVSGEAKVRGQLQLGSIGSGNHFVEIGEIEKIYLKEIASNWGVEEGLTYILIHTGSRGFGHQICQDFLNQFVKKGYAEGLPDKQLVCVPIQSVEGKNYWAAMSLAANYAFNNRQQILHGVREAFQEVFHIPGYKIPLLYDVCHNIAKMEIHKVEGKFKKLCVHRKGATRAFGPGADELAPIFQKTGQPVLVPGDMGRASHLMAGLGSPLTWCSCCHGAGRAKSRVSSLKGWSEKNVYEHMKKQGVQVIAHSYRTVAEEMPDAYKDVDIVVNTVEEAKLARKVARLKPHLVLKG